MTPAWLVPTARSIFWWPLAVVAACLAVAALLAAASGSPTAGLAGISAAGLAAAVVAGLRDPAAALLSAVPTSVAVRRVRRLALLVPVEVVAWIGAFGLPLGGLVALTAAGIAVAVWVSGPAGVAVPLAWVLVARAGAFSWDQHTELVTIAAAAALWTGRDR